MRNCRKKFANLQLAILTLFALASLPAFGANVVLAWDRSVDPRVVGYNVYAGGISHSYTNLVNAANNTSVTISNLIVGRVYFFAATCYYITGLESEFSTEISYTVPSGGGGSVPVFTVQPKSSTNSYGSALTLTASAGTNVTYQWLLNSQPLTWTGSKTASLPLPFLTSTNNGTYTLQASNSAGVAVSAPATVTVTPPPVSNVRVVGP